MPPMNTNKNVSFETPLGNGAMQTRFRLAGGLLSETSVSLVEKLNIV